MGARVEELEDGIVIHRSRLSGCEVHGYEDHRMVMALAVAGLASAGVTTVDTAESASVTYPSFLTDMQVLGCKLALL
jgi:3-phosphoshikimate 1-carboxyvinyltransferase